MGNVKKLIRYLIPILLLPLAGSLAQGMLTLLVASSLGAFYVAADSLTRSLYAAAGLALYAAALVGVALPAVRMEEGKAEAAKKARKGALIVFCLLIAALAAALLLLGRELIQLYNSSQEVMEIASVSLRYGALSILGCSLIAALLGQTRPAYSMKITLIFCAVMIGLWAAAAYVTVFSLQMGVAGLGLCRGGVFAATRIAPFLMIPVKSDAEEFISVRQEE